MKWSEMFKKSETLDVSGKNQVSIADVMHDYGRVHITKYAFCTTSNGDTAFVLFAESPNDFFFAPTVLNNMLRTIDADVDAKAKFDADGMTVAITETKSKNGKRTYYTFTPVD